METGAGWLHPATSRESPNSEDTEDSDRLLATAGAAGGVVRGAWDRAGAQTANPAG